MENSTIEKNENNQLEDKNLCMKKDQEDVLLICLNEIIDDSKYWNEFFNELFELNDYIEFYSDSLSFIEYIKSIKEEKKIILIIYNRISENILNEINSFDKIISIFIYYPKNSSYNINLNQYNKNQNIFTDENFLIKTIRIFLRRIFEETTGCILFNDVKQNLIRELRNQSSSFLWFHILIDVLKELPQADQAKQQMIDTCIQFYQTNDNIKLKIKSFSDNYQSSDAILWYTQDNFIYKLFNYALRTEDFQLLFFCRFYIIDLYQQIQELSKTYFLSSDIIKLYRGQMIIKKDFEKLKNNIGNFISPNGFFSTSKDFDIAFIYSGNNNDQLISVLFEIKIDPTKFKDTTKIIVADIEHLSQFPDEKEVLFGIGTIFRIEQIIQDSFLNKSIIKMTLSDQGLDHIQQYLQSIRNDLEETNSTRLFGKLLVELGQYNQAESYFNLILKTLSKDHEDFPSLYHGLGYIFYKKGKYSQAIQYDTIAYNIRKNILPENHLDIAKSCINLGSDYRQNHNYIIAMELFKEALRIREYNYLDKDHYNIATTLMSIGVTYTCLDDYENAFDYLTHALEIYQHVLPFNHPAIINVNIKFANIFEKKTEYNKALEYYQYALDTAEQILPFDHPRLLEYFQYIIKIYKTINRIDDAIQLSYEKMNHYRQLLEETHPNIIQFSILIKDLCDDKQRHSLVTT